VGVTSGLNDSARFVKIALKTFSRSVWGEFSMFEAREPERSLTFSLAALESAGKRVIMIYMPARASEAETQSKLHDFPLKKQS